MLLFGFVESPHIQCCDLVWGYSRQLSACLWSGFGDAKLNNLFELHWDSTFFAQIRSLNELRDWSIVLVGCLVTLQTLWKCIICYDLSLEAKDLFFRSNSPCYCSSVRNGCVESTHLYGCYSKRNNSWLLFDFLLRSSNLYWSDGP